MPLRFNASSVDGSTCPTTVTSTPPSRNGSNKRGSLDSASAASDKTTCHAHARCQPTACASFAATDSTMRPSAIAPLHACPRRVLPHSSEHRKHLLRQRLRQPNASAARRRALHRQPTVEGPVPSVRPSMDRGNAPSTPALTSALLALASSRCASSAFETDTIQPAALPAQSHAASALTAATIKHCAAAASPSNRRTAAPMAPDK